MSVLLRGIRHRAGRSAVVALLAAVAVAAAVLAPGFARAAQQSVLTDRLAAAPAAAAGLGVAAAGTATGAPAAHQSSAAARTAIDAQLAPPLAGALGAPVSGVDTDTAVTGGSEPLAARLAWRGGVCGQLAITGDCPEEAGQVLVSARTAEQYGIAAGDVLTVELAEVRLALDVVGTYAPRDPTAPYWGRTVYFVQGGFDPASGAPRVDALFTGGESDVQADPTAEVRLGLTYPLRPEAIRLDDVSRIRVPAGSAELAVSTDLPAILAAVTTDQDTIGQLAPIAAVPLVLLAAFVLFLLVAGVTEDRGREIGLAKLRGFPAGRAAWFGLGEVLLLIVAAAPVGLALGLGVVELAARTALADGSHAELRWPVVAAAGAALAVTALAALLAGRGTLRRGALELLRRVPARSRWRAGLAEGAVVALAAASVVAALGDRSAPLAMLAPALLALVAGIAAARLVRLWSAARLGRIRRIPVLLAAAQLARRPGGRRVIVVVTLAMALVSFGATAWDAAAQARHDRATEALGADRVYTVLADHPAALIEAVDRADPAGTSMAVVRAQEPYGGEPVALLAVETAKLAEVALGSDPVPSALLRPAEPAPLWLTDRVEVTAEVREPAAVPVRLTALVVAPGEPPQAISLGVLRAGTGDYAAALPSCAARCRLLGLGLGRTGAAGPFTTTVAIQAIRSGAGSGDGLAVRFEDPEAWSDGSAQNGAAGTQVTPGPALTVTVGEENRGDVVIEYRDTPVELPAVLAGPAPADDPEAGQFRFFGLSERPEPITVVARVDRLPRAGERGLLFDLEYAVSSAERRVALAESGGLRYEVWAGARAPADLPSRLASSGVAVLESESVTGKLSQLGRQAPALGLWLYLLAAVAAVALALGVVAWYGTPLRRADWAALRDTGVGERTLRRALGYEYAALLGVPLLVGLVVGVAAAVLMLPGMPLVEAGQAAELAYRPRLGAAPVALAAAVAGLLLVVLPAFWRESVRGRSGA
jgi:hypothetical protein